MKKEESGNYRQFYKKLVQHVRLHLAPIGVKLENVTNTAVDSMSISLLNMKCFAMAEKVLSTVNNSSQEGICNSVAKRLTVGSISTANCSKCGMYD